MKNLKLKGSEGPSALDAVKVTVVVPVEPAVGVPLTTPEEVFNDIPLGRVPDARA